jgi:hypothetical protein
VKPGVTNDEKPFPSAQDHNGRGMFVPRMEKKIIGK